MKDYLGMTRFVLLILVGMVLCAYIAIHLGDLMSPGPVVPVTTPQPITT